MPSYDFRCDRCGTFEEIRPLAEVGTPASCPSCALPARRIYAAPGFSVRGGTVRDATLATRRVVDRARSGEPVITGPPTGRRLPARPHAH